MARRKIVDHQKLIKMVQDGAAQADIMKKFGYSTSTQLKAAYANALMQTGQAASIIGGRKSENGTAKKSKDVKVGKRGSIIIPAELVAELGVAAEDTFSVRRSKSGIALTRIV